MRPQFWLWPNLLSLDAPLVALLWQTLFLRCLGAPIRALPTLLLAVTVWLIYVADRLLDVRHGVCLTARHDFYRRHFRAVLWVWSVVFVAVAATVVLGFAAGLVTSGIWLLAAVLVYLVCVHALKGHSSPGVKEGGVAVLFALGTSLPAWAWIHTPSDVLTVVLFSGLCWLNCVAIEQWETGPIRLPVRVIASSAAFLGLILLHRDRPILSGAEAVSLFALVLLDCLRLKLSLPALRVLADVALLSPVLFLPLVRG